MGVFARTIAAVAAALSLATVAGATEAEVFEHYRAYNTAFEEGRWEDAIVAAEAAWRAAEREWADSRSETAVLAYNLALLQMLNGRPSEAREPARRAAQLVEQGAAGETVQPEATMALVAAAQLDSDDLTRSDMRALEGALEAFTPANQMENSFAWMSWARVASARSRRGHWSNADTAADHAVALMETDPLATLHERGTVATIAARAAYESNRLEKAIHAAQWGIAAYPPQPAGEPIDPTLGRLLGWEGALLAMYASKEGEEFRQSDEALARPDWDEGRYADRAECPMEWVEQRRPTFPLVAAYSGFSLGRLFEFYLDPDGSVSRVDPVGVVDDNVGFTEAVVQAMRHWRANPQERAECRGPWSTYFFFMLEQ